MLDNALTNVNYWDLIIKCYQKTPNVISEINLNLENVAMHNDKQVFKKV